MEERIGESSLGEYARQQLENTRRDPRIDRSRGAIIADFFDALEEAERSRQLAMWGLLELARSLEREEDQLGVRQDDPGLTPLQRGSLQAAWERSEMASAEITNEFPFANASTLIAIFGALDAFVEELVPDAQQIIAQVRFEGYRERLAEERGIAWDDLPVEAREPLKASVIEMLANGLPQEPRRPFGFGVERYESVLRRADLDSPPSRPIPEDLDDALRELTALRHVLVHRGGRIDAQALQGAPSLRERYEDGQFVRLLRVDYLRYSAAVRAYGIDIAERVIPPESPTDLGGWRGQTLINT